MATRPLEVLVVDDEPALREVLSLRLRDWGYSVATAGDAIEADALLVRSIPDVVLTDIVLPGVSGIDLLRRFKQHDPSLPVILMTAHGNVDNAVEGMKAGASDFLTKPIDSETLRALMESLASEKRQLESDRSLDEKLSNESESDGLIGTSRTMRDIQQQVRMLASSDASALITGESGTGKEVVARAIHSQSTRRDAPFVAINAAAIPEGLIESEVFGHDVGAFTGASKARPGCFEMANGGTLFLDEIAEMPLALQPKLLRVLEDGRVRRLGSSREVAFDVRVVAATNRGVEDAIREGRLREDLFYRLNVFEIALPPLRDREGDITLLARHFLKVFNKKHGAEVVGLRSVSLERLQGWHWPGNVRELRNVMERAVVVARNGWIEPSHLPPYVKFGGNSSARTIELPPKATMAEAEKLLVLATLERTGQNKAEAARQLGLDVKTIRNKLRAWGVMS